MESRKPYPSDVSDEEWAFVAPYLALVREDAPQRTHDLREVFNGLRWIVRSGAPWRMLPHDFPPWEAVYQQTQRWLSAGAFEAMVHDLRALLRLAKGRDKEPTAAILDSRTLRSTPENGNRSGYDGAKRKRGSKVHAAVDTLGHLLALHVTAANEQDREQVEVLAEAIQEATGENMSWLMWIRATLERGRQKRLLSTAYNLRWSSTKRPGAALCFCRAGGLWSATLRGRADSGDWSRTTSDYRKR
jgi:transposase